MQTAIAKPGVAVIAIPGDLGADMKFLHTAQILNGAAQERHRPGQECRPIYRRLARPGGQPRARMGAITRSGVAH